MRAVAYPLDKRRFILRDGECDGAALRQALRQVESLLVCALARSAHGNSLPAAL